MNFANNRIISKTEFLISFGNILLFLVIYGGACLLNGGSCSGGSMGGAMMLYSFTAFLPQLLLFIYFAGFYLYKAACVFKHQENERPNSTDWGLIFVYVSLVLYVAWNMRP